MNVKSKDLPGSVLYLSHGGGPLPLLGDASHAELIDFLKRIPDQLENPPAIVVVSAHWEASIPTVIGGVTPSLLYDYSGFPPESYEIDYPVPGEPVLAKRIVNQLQSQGITAGINEQRGFDHGVFVPLKLMYPEAIIPCVQLSLVKGLNPIEHIRIGNALTELRRDNVLIIGSGFSFHNLRAFFSLPSEEGQILNEAFERWVNDTCLNADLNEDEREQRLINWDHAPGARYCHPREEHLLPLHVCYGATQSAAKKVFTYTVMGKQASSYLW